jgi:hypothetical protein
LATATIVDGSVTEISILAAGRSYPAAATIVTIDPPSAGIPQGSGWGTMTVTPRGDVKLVGKLGDGSAFSAGSFLHNGTHDSFALYAALYTSGQPGSLYGAAAFESLDASDSSAALTWTKPAQTVAGPYRSGFSSSVNLQAARYAGARSAPVLDYTTLPGHAKIVLSAGGLASPIQHALSVSRTNVVTVTDRSADRLTLTINPGAGTFTGSFLPGGGAKARANFGGAVYQRDNSAAGVFLDPSQAGNVIITPE